MGPPPGPGQRWRRGGARGRADRAVTGRPESSGSPDPGLEALVALSAGLAAGADTDLDPLLERARRDADPREVEEVLLQSYLFLGYPAALNGLARWRRISGREALPPAEDDWPGWGERGREVCRQVYGGAYPGLRTNIASLSPEMDRWMVHEGYGKVLGRAGLALWRRECCIVAVLSVLGTAPQLRSHLRGALRTGAPPRLVAAVLELALEWTPDHRRARAREAWDAVLERWEEK